MPSQDVGDVTEIVVGRGGLALGRLERLAGRGVHGGLPGWPWVAAPALRARPRRSPAETTNSTAEAPATITPDHTLGEKMNDEAKLLMATPICHSILIAPVR